MPISLEHHDVVTNRVRLHVVQAGPEDGSLVLLLHGFPEFWYGWRHQIGYLAERGYRVWAPDQRGYNRSGKPKGVSRYRTDVLAADVIGLIDAAGREKAFLVGHDWGGALAWWLAHRYPQRLHRLVVLNAPHGTVFRKNALTNPAQMLKSSYIGFFQTPWLPEALARLGDWRAPAQALIRTSRPGTFTAADLEHYRRAWSQPRAYTSMLNWYRAAAWRPPVPGGDPRIRVPTLLIWGARDRFLGGEMARPSVDLCDDGRLEWIEGATHWVQHEEPERVNRLLEAFLRPGESPPPR